MARILRPDGNSQISIKEFYTVVTNLWGAWRGSPKPCAPSRIGLAVSGGADSMALAFLCKQLISERLIPDLNVKPFIVDHRAREGSTEEAHKVAGWLEELGFDPSILTLRWPNGTDPSSLSDFETLARKFRYQILGQACKEYNTRALFLGHHLDDNIETVLSRLTRGQRQATGLKGVASVGHIPECHGIYGVAESGSFIRLMNARGTIASTRAREPKGRRRQSQNEAQQQRSSSTDPHHRFRADLKLPIADGGIYLFRPLNSFPKSRLTATCLQNGIQFANDQTNFDPTITSRNTIRYLLLNDMLPRALQAPSILHLIDNSQRISEELNKKSNSFLQKVQVRKLDFRTGSLVLEFPPPRVMEDVGICRDVSVERSPAKIQKILAIALRRLLDLVAPAPKNDIPLEKLAFALQTIFPAAEASTGEVPAPLKRDIFTVGGVKFEPVKLPKIWAGEPSISLKSFDSRKQNDVIVSISDVRNTWLLTRVPHSRSIPKPVSCFDLQLPDSSIADNMAQSPWSNWQLWDNRYWIRVRAEKPPLEDLAEKGHFESTGTDIPLVVRSMESSDLADVRRRLVKYTWSLYDKRFDASATKSSRPSFTTLKTRHQLDELLMHHAPNDLRYTIPVIAEATGQRRVLAFPSFGVKMPVIFTRRLSDNNTQEDHWTLNWQINYKHIDPDLLKLVSRDLDMEIFPGRIFSSP
ncbi:tRNA(Ile)-lysidine synthetase [Emergomyces pasteurianus Ep9510]|uniref:tRNA(Ile)-lysidine synthetase n=1 Tax=Emergomyces pasteurianus Ep9510 TaxID=1447872 RepID=A0A1J9PS91_9EURO|nr:tRNA(Ile)-lysidine synthetase [Emergomyces pasteurianus Ep9510]